MVDHYMQWSVPLGPRQQCRGDVAFVTAITFRRFGQLRIKPDFVIRVTVPPATLEDIPCLRRGDQAMNMIVETGFGWLGRPTGDARFRSLMAQK
jgi:hypothetical protein